MARSAREPREPRRRRQKHQRQQCARATSWRPRSPARAASRSTARRGAATRAGWSSSPPTRSPTPAASCTCPTSTWASRARSARPLRRSNARGLPRSSVRSGGPARPRRGRPGSRAAPSAAGSPPARATAGGGAHARARGGAAAAAPRLPRAGDVAALRRRQGGDPRPGSYDVKGRRCRRCGSRTSTAQRRPASPPCSLRRRGPRHLRHRPRPHRPHRPPACSRPSTLRRRPASKPARRACASAHLRRLGVPASLLERAGLRAHRSGAAVAVSAARLAERGAVRGRAHGGVAEPARQPVRPADRRPPRRRRAWDALPGWGLLLPEPEGPW